MIISERAYNISWLWLFLGAHIWEGNKVTLMLSFMKLKSKRDSVSYVWWCEFRNFVRTLYRTFIFHFPLGTISFFEIKCVDMRYELLSFQSFMIFIVRPFINTRSNWEKSYLRFWSRYDNGFRCVVWWNIFLIKTLKKVKYNISFHLLQYLEILNWSDIFLALVSH